MGSERCPACARQFKSRLAVGVHIARSESCSPFLTEFKRQSQRVRDRRRRPERVRHTPESRRAARAEAKRRWRLRYRRPSRAKSDQELQPLFPELLHGKRVSFWEDELRIDLAQEHVLAILEGRDPDEAVAAYQKRELSWRFFCVKQHEVGQL